jgi:LysM domain
MTLAPTRWPTLHHLGAHLAAHLVALSIAAIALVGAPCVARAQPADTEEYKVVAGDSCLSIAKRVLGSPKALEELHRLNPQLGPTPHTLVAGQVLRVPRRAEVTPDANLTGARGDVAVRKPTASVWDAARRGMELFRAWRVGARERSSAEVTFRDQTQMHLRENTVVIIYGPAAPRQPVSAVRAEVEGGTLEARLAAATGEPRDLQVLTPSALTTFGFADVLFSVDPAGTSLIANHAGAPAEVRAVTKKQARGAAVRVASGMGSRVEKGKLPEPPRPLPAAPALGPATLIVATFAASASVPLSWQPVDGAVQYRAVVFDDQGVEQNVVIIPPGQTSLSLADVPPGNVSVQISAIDSAGFEGPPARLGVNVVAIAAAAPGRSDPSAATGATTSATTEHPRVALGSRIVEPAAPIPMTCALSLQGSAPASPGSAAPPASPPSADALIVRQPGHYRVSCAPASGAEAVAAVAAEFDVPPVTASVVGPAPLVPRDQAVTLRIAVTSDAPLSDVAASNAAGPPGPTLGKPPGLTPGQPGKPPGLTIESQHWDGHTLTLAVRGTASAALREPLRLVVPLSTGEVELASLSLAVEDTSSPAPTAAPPRWRIGLGGFAGLLLPPAGSGLGHPTSVRDELTSGPLLGGRLVARRRAQPWLAGRLELGVSTLSQRGSSKSAALILPAASVALRPAALGSIELWTFAGGGLARLLGDPGSIRPQTTWSLEAGAGVAAHNAALTFELCGVLSWLDPSGLGELWPSVRLGIGTSWGP